MNPTILNIIDEENILKFTITGIDCIIINSIRRVLLSEIPCFVFRTFPYADNKVIIDINTTRFNNEIIKQRLSCIPIHISDIKFPYKDHIIEVEKFNQSQEIMYVTTKDFKVKNITNDTYLTETAVNTIFPPDPITNQYIDFLRLQPSVIDNLSGEQIKLSAKLDIGTAKENGAFNVVSSCSFGNSIDSVAIETAWLEHEKTLNEEEKQNLEFNKKDWLLIKGERYYKDNSFDFLLETIGIYSNFELMILACDIIIMKLKNFIQNIQENTIIKPDLNTINNYYSITLENEDFTLGKILEFLIFTLYFNKDINFCSFNQIHPHISSSTIKLSFINDVTDEFILSILTNASNEGIKIYELIKSNFQDN